MLSYLLKAASSDCSNSVKNSVRFEEVGGLYIENISHFFLLIFLLIVALHAARANILCKRRFLYKNLSNQPCAYWKQSCHNQKIPG